ncbi:hypothetical protein ACIQ9Q_24970 [Streptomyces sp. NPDC094438]|uniref:hypothetical protein n=1 Tax=Streptomyces sp. NPDC094438 TaxID=3366061 RepID=UPI003829BA45
MKAVNPDGTVPDPMPPTAWTTYLATDSVDATLKAVTDAGGTVVMGAQNVMDLGRMAIITAPTGTVVGLWQAGTFDGAGIVNEHGALIWNELNTGDTCGAADLLRGRPPSPRRAHADARRRGVHRVQGRRALDRGG